MLWLRDITQAYVQSHSELNRKILAYLLKQLRHQHPPNSIMEIVKPLYGIAEAGTHWWVTYHRHHLEKLQMTTSTYDPCLLIAQPSAEFAIIAMQTDDMLGISTAKFADHKEEELTKAQFAAKPKQFLSSKEPLTFNGGILMLNKDDSITLRQKGQATKLQPIDGNAHNAK